MEDDLGVIFVAGNKRRKVMHESRILEEKKSGEVPILDVRLEDLKEDTRREVYEPVYYLVHRQNK
jgi:hypothetical protein